MPSLALSGPRFDDQQQKPTFDMNLLSFKTCLKQYNWRNLLDFQSVLYPKQCLCAGEGGIDS